eukprot:TRINITY_DN4481_c0_g1_i1.p1 TRINITY_DN4481_c0_g1~~TRINITY_DN4481_c0_g1_i1.p1  ORF type:complete len:1321 (+),score=467.55 TRINITY_DN4481_c0_g1_i1:60-4022(+)
MSSVLFENVVDAEAWAAKARSLYCIDAAEVVPQGIRVVFSDASAAARCLGYLCSTAGPKATFVAWADVKLGEDFDVLEGARCVAVLASPGTMAKVGDLQKYVDKASEEYAMHIATVKECAGYLWVTFKDNANGDIEGSLDFIHAEAASWKGKGGALLPRGSRCLTFGPTDSVKATLTDGRAAAPVAIPQPPGGVDANGVSQANPVAVSSMPLAEQVQHLALPLARAVVLRHPAGAASVEAVKDGTAAQVAVFHSPGVHCKSCVSKICRKLKKEPFALAANKDFHYNLEEKNLYVVLPAANREDMYNDIQSMLADCDLPAASPVAPRLTLKFNVTNVVCGSCTALLRRTLRPRKVDVSMEDGVMSVHADALDDLEAVSSGIVKAVLELKKFGIEYAGSEEYAMPLPAVIESNVDPRDAALEELLTAPSDPSEDTATAGVGQSPLLPPQSAPAPVGGMVESSFVVTGMTCASCASRVEGVVEDAGGAAVESVVVNFSTAVAKVKHDIAQFSCEDVIRVIVEQGFGAKPFTDAEDLRNTLTAASALEEKKKAAKVSLLLAMPLMLLFMVFKRIKAVDQFLMIKIFSELCIGPVLQFIVATPVVVLYGWTFFEKAYLALSHKSFTMDVLVALGVGTAYLASFVALAGSTVGMKAHEDVKFHTASTLIAFLLAGRWMEQKAKAETTQALVSLMDMQPKRAILMRDGVAVDVDVDEVKCGDELRVLQGQAIPVDGVIISGLIAVDEAMVTGESVAVTKTDGAKVAGGTTCVEGTAQIRATEIGANSCVAKILKLVADAQQSKAPVQKFADQVSSVFVPIVIGYAVVVFAVWLICGYTGLYPDSWRRPDQGVWSFSLDFLIASLVVACPCAMGLATPTAVMVGTGVGATHGVYIKGGEALEESSHVSSVVFDKTGTLSTGKIVINNSAVFLDKEQRPGEGLSEKDVLMYVMLSEAVSSHPVAAAVAGYIEKKLGTTGDIPVASHVTTPGKGIEAQICGYAVKVGNTKFVIGDEAAPGSPTWREGDLMNAGNQYAHLSPSHAAAAETAATWKQQGETVVMATIGGHAAVFAMSDGPKKEARAVVQYLQRQGVQCYLVTGDNCGAAQRFANIVGIPISHVRAEVLPGEKAEFVQYLQTVKDRLGGVERESQYPLVGDEEEPALMQSLTSQESAISLSVRGSSGLVVDEHLCDSAKNEVVAFIGDGINDAPALAQANVGVALGAGTAVAIDAADCVLSRSNLCDVATFLELSRATMNRIKLNFFWAFSYNVVVLPFAGGMLFPFTRWQMPPAMGGLAMMFSSLFVVLCSLHLRRFSPPVIPHVAATRDVA